MLPLDIIFLILDLVAQIRDRKISLRSCSLVCQEWNTIARTYIFRRITINGGSSVGDFLHILKSSPHLGKLITQVRYVQDSIFMNGAKSSQLLLLVQSLPAVVPNLHTLFLHGVFRGRPNDNALQIDLLTSLSGLTSVEKLNITDSVIPIPHLVAYISSFPNLRHLNVHWLEAALDDEPLGSPIISSRSSCQLSSLRLRNIDDLPIFFHRILSSALKHTLRSLILAVGNQDSSHVSSFLRDVGPRLEHLDLTLITYYDVGPVSKYRQLCTFVGFTDNIIVAYRESLNISPCNNVKRLTLRPAYHSLVPSLVSQISSSSLEELRFSVPDFRVSDLSKYHDLADLVKGLGTSTLKRITLIYKREIKEMEKATPHLHDAFRALENKMSFSVVHASEIKRWWK